MLNVLLLVKSTASVLIYIRDVFNSRSSIVTVTVRGREVERNGVLILKHAFLDIVQHLTVCMLLIKVSLSKRMERSSEDDY